ncbi:hypothetical protein Esti_000278 [Eimeria stiedai]
MKLSSKEALTLLACSAAPGVIFYTLRRSLFNQLCQGRANTNSSSSRGSMASRCFVLKQLSTPAAAATAAVAGWRPCCTFRRLAVRSFRSFASHGSSSSSGGSGSECSSSCSRFPSNDSDSASRRGSSSSSRNACSSSRSRLSVLRAVSPLRVAATGLEEQSLREHFVYHREMLQQQQQQQRKPRQRQRQVKGLVAAGAAAVAAAAAAAAMLLGVNWQDDVPSRVLKLQEKLSKQHYI